MSLCSSFYDTLDGVEYDFFCTKEPDYVMKIVSTYGGLLVKEGQRDSKRVFVKNEEEKKLNLSTPNHLRITLTTAILLMITIIYDIRHLLLRKHGGHIGGQTVCLYFYYLLLK